MSLHVPVLRKLLINPRKYNQYAIVLPYFLVWNWTSLRGGFCSVPADFVLSLGAACDDLYVSVLSCVWPFVLADLGVRLRHMLALRSVENSTSSAE